MAKLKAHGTELLRLSREYDLKSDITGEITRYRETRSYRSDGHIMQKMGFLQTSKYADGWYDWGWKLFKKVKKHSSIQDLVQKHLADRAGIEAKGWKFELPEGR